MKECAKKWREKKAMKKESRSLNYDSAPAKRLEYLIFCAAVLHLEIPRRDCVRGWYLFPGKIFRNTHYVTEFSRYGYEILKRIYFKCKLHHDHIEPKIEGRTSSISTSNVRKLAWNGKSSNFNRIDPVSIVSQDGSSFLKIWSFQKRKREREIQKNQLLFPLPRITSFSLPGWTR